MARSIRSPARRDVMLAGAALAAQAAWPASVRAQAAWPSKPLRIVVPAPPGGGTDVAARALAQQLSASLGKPVLVDNRAGADGAIAALEARRAEPDGHTLFLAIASAFSYVPATRRNPGYDPIADFVPLSHFLTFTFYLMVHESIPGKTLDEVLAYIRANPGKVSYASGNSTGILGMAQLATSAGLDMVHVPYKGESLVAVDLVPGRVQLFWATPAVIPQLMKDGRVRPVAVLLPQRSAQMPDVPTIAEAGQPLVSISPWAGVFAPARTPKDVAERLSAELRAAMAKPELVEQLARVGINVRSSSPEELARITKEQLDAFSKAARLAKIPVE